MPLEQDARKRAVICQNCWFWQQNSCALPNPEDEQCANKRSVTAVKSVHPTTGKSVTPPLTPMAEGHHLEVGEVPTGPLSRQTSGVGNEPFSDQAEESTFTIRQAFEHVPRRVGVEHGATPEMSEEFRHQVVQPIRAKLPTFKQIKARHAAAAATAPASSVRIPLEKVEAQLRLENAAPLEDEPVSGVGVVNADQIDTLVARVRRRTAERLQVAARL